MNEANGLRHEAFTGMRCALLPSPLWRETLLQGCVLKPQALRQNERAAMAQFEATGADGATLFVGTATF